MVRSNKQVDSAEIVRDEAVEAPLSTKNIREQILVDRVRRAVNCVVRRHHRLRMAFHDRVFPMGEPVFHQIALVDLRRKPLTVRLHVVDRKVLYGRSKLQIVGSLPWSLNISHCHSAREVGIFAEDLLDTSPKWIAADINNRRTEDEAMLRARTVGTDVIERPASSDIAVVTVWTSAGSHVAPMAMAAGNK